MRTITKKYQLYNYLELSEEAREKAKAWYLEGQDSEAFTETCTEDLNALLNNSDLKLQYSLSYCQGDGLNIYGELDLTDVISIIRGTEQSVLSEFENALTEKELKTIEAYMEVCGRYIELPYNSGGYNYCIAGLTEFAEEWAEELQDQEYKNIQVDTLRKLENVIREMFTVLSSVYEASGYDYFYEADDETMEMACEINGWMFLEDGSYFMD